jgi:hypothetical protein
MIAGVSPILLKVDIGDSLIWMSISEYLNKLINLQGMPLEILHTHYGAHRPNLVFQVNISRTNSERICVPTNCSGITGQKLIYTGRWLALMLLYVILRVI